MIILNTVLAFALTMLVLSTIVTQIVSVLRNTAKLRNDELQKMLKEYFQDELQPVMEREMHRLNSNISDKVASELTEASEKFDHVELFKDEELRKLGSLATEELVERLKRSELGEKLLKELGSEAQTVFDELGRRYEVVGNKFTESFRDNSRKWATGIALILALAVNIDSINIVKSYYGNDDMRDNVIAQQDAFLEDYSLLVDSLEKENSEDPVTKEQLKKALNESQEKIADLQSVGFPIGWDYFPYSGCQKDKAKIKEYELKDNPAGWASWILGIILTSLLAGLGSPFWYDAVSGISRIAQKARTIKKPVA